MRNVKLLLVEDDLDLLTDLVIFLSSNYLVFTAGDSREAANIFEKTQPDCCVIDINLPHFLNEHNEYEGLVLAQEMYARGINKPAIIFISQMPFPKGTSTVPDYKFFRKPLKVSDLLDTIAASTPDSLYRV